jgi:hypothetical protein
MRHDDFYPAVRLSVICLSTPHGGVPMDESCTRPLSSDPKSKLEYHSSSLYQKFLFAKNIHSLDPLVALQSDHNQNLEKEREKEHTQEKIAATHVRNAKTGAQVQDHTRTTHN